MKTKDELMRVLKGLPKGTEIQCTHSTAAIYAVGDDRRPHKIFDFWESPTFELKASGSAGVVVIAGNIDFGDKSFTIESKPVSFDKGE